jgi:hypothetical protein
MELFLIGGGAGQQRDSALVRQEEDDAGRWLADATADRNAADRRDLEQAHLVAGDLGHLPVAI